MKNGHNNSMKKLPQHIEFSNTNEVHFLLGI